jgi:hypothetical protein
VTQTLRTRASLEDAIVAWVDAALPGGRVALGWQKAPRHLPTPYVTVRIAGITPIGQDDRLPVDLETGEQDIYGDRLVTVSCQAFGAGALDRIRALSNSIWRETIAAGLLAAGLCPQMPGPINDLTQLLETEPEERAHVDINFGVKDLYSDQVGVIEHVEGDGTVVEDGQQDSGTYGDSGMGDPIGGSPLLTVSFAADLE